MEPLCAHENHKCVNYGFEDWPIIEVARRSAGFVKDVTHLLIVYVMEGTIDVSFGTVNNYLLRDGDLMLFPPGIKLSVRTKSGPATMVMFKVRNRVVLCDKYVFGQTGLQTNTAQLRHSHLEANQMVRLYMDMLVDNITGPLNCYRFMDIKILEMFHYLKAYYRAEDLARFTLPLVSPDSQFMYFKTVVVR